MNEYGWHRNNVIIFKEWNQLMFSSSRPRRQKKTIDGKRKISSRRGIELSRVTGGDTRHYTTKDLMVYLNTVFLVR